MADTFVVCFGQELDFVPGVPASAFESIAKVVPIYSCGDEMMAMAKVIEVAKAAHNVSVRMGWALASDVGEEATAWAPITRIEQYSDVVEEHGNKVVFAFWATNFGYETDPSAILYYCPVETINAW